MELLQTSILKFVFQQVAIREGQQWLGATRIQNRSESSTSPVVILLESWNISVDPKTRARLRGVETLTQLLESHMLKGVRLDSHMGLWGLASEKYPLRLRHDIPSPMEMLERQCLGERFVTYLNDPADLNKKIGRFNGAFEFLMHDLEHAHKFFGDPELFRGQVNFFNLLKATLPQFEEWRPDSLFEKDLNYLMSDMNSHPVHLFKYLKAIVLTADLRRGGEDQRKLDIHWEDIFDRWQTPLEVRKAAHRINRPGLETSEDQILIHDFFKAAPI